MKNEFNLVVLDADRSYDSKQKLEVNLTLTSTMDDADYTTIREAFNTLEKVARKYIKKSE